MDRFTTGEILGFVYLAASPQDAVLLFWVTYGLRRVLLDSEPVVDCFSHIEDVFRRILQEIEVRQQSDQERSSEKRYYASHGREFLGFPADGTSKRSGRSP